MAEDEGDDGKGVSHIAEMQELQVLLRQKDDQLDLLKRELDKTRRQCDKANSFNEDLRKQVDELSVKLAGCLNKQHIGTQTEEATADWTVESQISQVSVAECVRAAAEAAQVQTGFIYDESTGYYYDATSGYYYNGENGLYFDTKTGTFFYYDAESETYKFHSQVEVPKQDAEVEEKEETHKSEGSQRDRKKRRSERRSSKRKKSSHSKKKKKKKKSHRSRDSYSDSDDSWSRRRRVHSSSAEEGECSDSSRSREREDCSSPRGADKDSDDAHAPKWPPCVRAIVLKTELPKLTVGTLFIVTCQGAVVGRETPADLYVPDILVSKAHAKFEYDGDDKRYRVRDMGSQNGTFLNDTRLSEAKRESEAHDVNHGDVLRVGCTELLLHIHDGAETCDSCEPGLAQAAAAAAATLENGVQIVTKQEKEQERRWQLKQMRKKFGLEDAAYKEGEGACGPEGYEDRAKIRRKTKGVDHPHAKTEMASVDTAIPTCNKGFKLLEKMGWSSGQSLGKSQSGITEPINVASRGSSKAGVGSEVPIGPESAQTSSAVEDKWQKARQRYDQIAQ